jgi:hypothetical protein
LKIDLRDADGQLYKPHEAVIANPKPMDAERVDGHVYGPVPAPDGSMVVAQWDEARQGWIKLKEYPSEKAEKHLPPKKSQPTAEDARNFGREWSKSVRHLPNGLPF